MNKRFTAAVITIMLLACVVLFAGCPAENTGNPVDNEQQMQALKQAFDRLSDENYTMDTVIKRDIDGVLWYEYEEISRDGNVFFAKGNELYGTSDRYYEFA